MNEIEMIRNKFDFLLQHGFSGLCEKSNLEYYVAYSNEKVTIALSYDLRSHRLDVGLINNQDKKKNISYIPLSECKIAEQKGRDELVKKIEDIYLEARNDWTITKNHLCSIVDIYRDFIEQNLAEIVLVFQ